MRVANKGVMPVAGKSLLALAEDQKKKNALVSIVIFSSLTIVGGLLYFLPKYYRNKYSKNESNN